MRHTAGLFETAIAGEESHDGAFGSLSYRYQRADLELSGVDWPAYIYGRPGLNRASDGLFFHTGMSAIGATLHAIGSQGWPLIDISRTAYYEIVMLCDQFFPSLSLRFTQDARAGDPDVAWLDTWSNERPDSSLGGFHPRLLVGDTSAVEPDSALLDEWLETSASLDVPLLLIRSHLKLDTFGLELGKLGSIVVVAPNDAMRRIEPLMIEIRDGRRLLGLGFELANLYPWLGLPEFLELTAARTAAIRRQTEAVATALEDVRLDDDPFEVVRTHHQMFVRIRTPLSAREDAAVRGSELIASLASVCARDGIPAVIGGSFGLDQFTFREYVDGHDGRLYVRVTGADVLDGHAEALGRSIRDVLVEGLADVRSLSSVGADSG